MREVLVNNEEFKDSPLGKIPKDWEVCALENKLQQIIDYRGKTPEKTNSGVPLITAKNVRDGYLDPEPREYIDETNYDIWMRRGFPKAEDILFTTEAPLGNVARVPSYKIALAQRLLTLRASPEELDAGYLFWLLNWSESRRRLEQKSTGSTVLGIKQSVFRKILFRFPPCSEQERIAEILDTVDEAIARTSSLIIKLKQTKAGLLQDLLTRGLDEDGKLRDPQAHPEQFKDSALGLIPKDWDISHVDTQFEITAGFTLGEHRRPRNNKRKYLRVANVHRDEIVLDDIAELEAEDNELSSRLLEKDDLLIVEGHANPDEIGRCAIVPVEAVGLTFQNHLFRLRCKSLNPNFALAWLNSEWVRAYWRRLCGTSSGLNTINRTMLNAIFVPISTQDEQIKIVAIIDTYKRRIRTEEAYLNKLKLQKQGLMQDLLTGKVRVKNL